MQQVPQVLCCFCGNVIERGDLDPCALFVVARWSRPGQEAQQQVFCHADCLRVRLHPALPLAVLTPPDDPDIEAR